MKGIPGLIAAALAAAVAPSGYTEKKGNTYVAHASSANRLSQKGKRKRAKWVK